MDCSPESWPNRLGLRASLALPAPSLWGSGWYPDVLLSAAHWLRPSYKPDIPFLCKHKTVIRWITFPTQPFSSAMLPQHFGDDSYQHSLTGLKFLSPLKAEIGSSVHHAGPAPTVLAYSSLSLSLQLPFLLDLLLRVCQITTQKSKNSQQTVEFAFLNSSLYLIYLNHSHQYHFKLSVAD